MADPYINTFAGQGGVSIQLVHPVNQFDAIEAGFNTVDFSARSLRAVSETWPALTLTQAGVITFDIDGIPFNAPFKTNSAFQDAPDAAANRSGHWHPCIQMVLGSNLAFTGSSTTAITGWQDKTSTTSGTPAFRTEFVAAVSAGCTIPRAGRYLCSMSGWVSIGSTNNAYLTMKVNGSAIDLRSGSAGGVDDEGPYPQFIGVVNLAEGDTVGFEVTHTGNGTVNAYSTNLGSQAMLLMLQGTDDG